jgi:hypothetical protein
MTVPIEKINQYLGPVILALIGTEAKRATKFISPKWVISAQRISFKNRINRRERNIDIRVKIGDPNYHERKLIKDCIKAGEPFPVKKIRLAYFRA